MNSTLKKTLTLAAVAALVFNGSAALAQNGRYVLKGNIAAARGSIYLEHEVDGKPVIVDSTKTTDGNFMFKGAVKTPEFYSISSKSMKYPVQFILENSAIQVTRSKDSLAVPEIKGSAAQDIYMGFYEGPWKAITVKAGDIYGRLDKAEQSGKMDSVTRAGFNREFRALDTVNIAAVKAYVAANPASAGSAAVIYDRFIGYPNFPVATALYAVLTKEAQQSAIGRQISSALETDAKTAKGKTAPAIAMADKDGKIVKLSDFKGKYVLIDFWASWCGPCRKENPNVVAAYKKYHDKGFEILGISLDSKKDAWLKAIAADGLTWTHVSELQGWSNTAATAYGVKSVPASFLLDPEGKVVGKDLRGEELNKTLAGLFK